MVRMESLSEPEQKLLMSLPCPTFDTDPWAEAPAREDARIAIITTAGLHTRNDRPFRIDLNDFYRVIPGDVKANDLVMSHLAASFDRSGFQRDWNVCFPLDRLRELESEGIIGSLAAFHYSVSSAHSATEFDAPAREIARLLKRDNVNAALLLPV
ncbi:MAG: glycine/sarcosine/betaine reductase selenoprotein B family protein [Dehalococcoidia bacterium]